VNSADGTGWYAAAEGAATTVEPAARLAAATTVASRLPVIRRIARSSSLS
jgi:hypothetical protein